MPKLSVFIDESGDFGPYAHHCPYYIVTLLLHDQNKSIDDQISHLKRHVVEAGFDEPHAVHSAPLIRREKDYSYLELSERRKLFRHLLTFLRLCDVKYKSFVFLKREFDNSDSFVSSISRELGGFVKDNLQLFTSYEQVVVYYDGGQKELTNIINVVFNAFLHADVRRVMPSDYCLFQAADMACTLELLNLKYKANTLSKSELEFFRGRRNLYKNYLKTVYQKRF